MFSRLEPYQYEDLATGSYYTDYPTCGEPYLNTLSDDSAEILLALHYATPVMPDQIEIFTGSGPINIKYIELLNSLSGLGRLVFEGQGLISSQPISVGACKQRLTLPVNVDIEIDTIFISFSDLASAAQVNTVEMLGRLESFSDPSVFWRVPLPDISVDIAVGQNGLVYAAVEPNGLYTFDVEGNQLKQFSVPTESRLTSVATDLNGNLIVTDSTYGWFIKLSSSGEQLSAGGDNTDYQAAVNPVDGNLYLLQSNAISIYDSDSTELIRQITLDEQMVYGSMAFNQLGQLYALCLSDYPATLVELDTLTGEALDTILFGRSNFGEIIARDLAIDGSGNFYILFSHNTAQMAVHQLDARGNLIKRFGRLTPEYTDWPEGEFFDPRAIAVAQDGRFIFIADGHEDSAFLTAYLIEAE